METVVQLIIYCYAGVHEVTQKTNMELLNNLSKAATIHQRTLWSVRRWEYFLAAHV